MVYKTIPYYIEAQIYRACDVFVKFFISPHVPLKDNEEKNELWKKAILQYVLRYLKPFKVIIGYARYENDRRLEKDLVEIREYDSQGNLINKYELLW